MLNKIFYRSKVKSKGHKYSSRSLHLEQYEDRRMLSVVPFLASNPDSLNKIYLDFDGHTVTDTKWTLPNGTTLGNTGGKPIHAPIYNMPGDSDYVYDPGLDKHIPLPFSQQELNYIEMAWRIMAEDFAPFDVDITTVEPDASAFTANAGTSGVKALRVLFTSRFDDSRLEGTGKNWVDLTSTTSGVGAFDSWTVENTDRPVWVFANHFDGSPNPNWPHPDIQGGDWGPIQEYMGTVGSHEVGHGFGLNHDSVDTDFAVSGYFGDSTYYAGHGSGETSWGPILGGSELRTLTQWSKLQYDGAVQDGGGSVEDDIAIIADALDHAGGTGFRDDDHGDSLDFAVATPLTFYHDTLATCGGIIGGSSGTANGNDVDVFYFEAGPNNVNISINVDPMAVGPNLDVELQVFDSNGVLVWNPASPPSYVNPVDSISAHYTFQGSGQYFIRIDGVNHDPFNDFSDYGSLGQYKLSVLLGNDAPRIVNLSLGNSASDEVWFSRVSGTGEQLRTVPVADVNRVSIAFSEFVSVSQNDLTLTNLDGASPAISNVSFDTATNTAHWTLASPIGDGRLLLTLSDSVTDIGSNALDGEFRNPWELFGDDRDDFPSGDRYEGGEFRFRFTILDADTDRNNIDGSTDYTNWHSIEPGMIYVSTTVDEVDSDLSFGDVSLREAVQHANAQSVPTAIDLPAGQYQLTRIGTEAGDASYNDLDITGEVTVLGDGAGLSVIDSSGMATYTENRIFDVAAGGFELSLRWVTLTSNGGTATVDGKAIRVNADSTLTVEDSAIADNQTIGFGTGIYVQGGDVTLSRSVFTNNGYYKGGALTVVASGGADPAEVTIGYSIFALNTDHARWNGNIENIDIQGAANLNNEGYNLHDGEDSGFFNNPTDHFGATNYVVTTIEDTFDHTNDSNSLSIREAIDLANLAAGQQEIWLPAWDFLLNRDRAHYGGGSLTDTDVSFGDLDISESLVVRGVADKTSVAWSNCEMDAIFDLLGDYTGDGINSADDGDVDGADYFVWSSQVGSSGGVFSADGDDDGDVDGDDLDIYYDHLGYTLDLVDIFV